MSDVDKLRQDIRTQRVIQYLDDKGGMRLTLSLSGDRLWSLSDPAVVERIVKIKDNEIKQACIECLQSDHKYTEEEIDMLWDKPLNWVLLHMYKHILREELDELNCAETNIEDIEKLEELLESCIQAKKEIKRNKKWWQLW